MSDPQARSAPISAYLLSFLVLAFFLYQLAPTQADPDLWGHVRFGGDLLRTGQFLRADPYSYASGIVPWINHEWLAEVVFFLAWSIAAGTGLVLVKTAVGMTVAGGLWTQLLRADLKPVRAAILLVAASFALLPSLGTVRPQMFTVLLFAAELRMLKEAEHGNSKALWPLPLVFALWINLHGGVLAGLGVLIVYAAVGIVSRRRVGEQVPAYLWWIPAACVLALFLNPFGWRLPEFLLRTATIPRPDISEWASLRLVSFTGAAYLALLLASGTALLRRPDRSTPALIAVWAVTALAPLTAARHAALFAVAALTLGAEPIAALGPSRDEVSTSADTRRPGLFRRLPGQAVLAAGGLIFLVLSVPAFRRVTVGPGFDYPARAVDLLERSGVQGKLAIQFDWGQYALWHLYPEILVAPDGRRETVYDEDTYRRYLAFEFGTGDWDAFLEEPRADMALVRPGSPASNLLAEDEDWTLIHRDSTAVLYGRAGWQGSATVRSEAGGDIPSDGTGMRFP
jgi:hypothetical protein